jgi:ADP-ribose pyrophosphatase YjhB (NUDIX family)
MKPKRAADIVIKDANNRTLFIERKNAPLGIALPGGMIDPGETSLQAALRE